MTRTPIKRRHVCPPGCALSRYLLASMPAQITRQRAAGLVLWGSAQLDIKHLTRNFAAFSLRSLPRAKLSGCARVRGFMSNCATPRRGARSLLSPTVSRRSRLRRLSSLRSVAPGHTRRAALRFARPGACGRPLAPCASCAAARLPALPAFSGCRRCAPACLSAASPARPENPASPACAPVAASRSPPLRAWPSPGFPRLVAVWFVRAPRAVAASVAPRLRGGSVGLVAAKTIHKNRE